MSSVFAGIDKKVQAKSVPVDFTRAAGQFVTLLRESLDQNEVRALAANQVASPVLQVRVSFCTGYSFSYMIISDASGN